MNGARGGAWRTAGRLAAVWGLLLLLLAAGLTALDRFVAAPAVARGDYHWIVFEPNSEYQYQTLEFYISAAVNNLGFRDRPVSTQKGGAFRILALGDSFTYGWGVEDCEPWPKVLEKRLHARGLDVEILNLGRPGAAPRHHVAIAETAFPLLQPDLVLVALLQGDEVASNRPWTNDPVVGRPDHLLRLDPFPVRWARAAWPSLLLSAERVLRRPTRMTAAQTVAIFKQRAADMMAVMRGEDCEKLAQGDPLLRAAFEEGYVTPGVLAMAVMSPEHFRYTMQYGGEALDKDTRRMGVYLRLVREAAEAQGVPIVAFSVPHPAYCTEESNALLADLGFSVSPDMFQTDTADLVVREACRRGKMRFVSVMPEFRMAARVEELFFPIDLHLNRRGHEVYADLLIGPVETLVASIQRGAGAYPR